MGHQYWGAYQRALALGAVVPSAETAACGKAKAAGEVTTDKKKRDNQ